MPSLQPNARGTRSKAIEEVALGERTVGRNPLREEVDEVEPDPATWRRIDLEMRKQDGQRLWIGLLRPLDWIEQLNATAGATIPIDLPEMGAIGEAEVIAIGPCPPIHSGEGAVVTGTFRHETDGRNVVALRLEGQEKPTGVTNNHRYWSVDRQDYVEVGDLRPGEEIDTIDGHHCVESIAPLDYTGYLYNLETTEHVYRVDGLGALVHNACVPKKLTRTQSDEYREAARNVWHSRTNRRAFWDGMEVHHRIPLEWAHKFPKADPNRAANLIGLK
ncbi:MAG: hypothetical protein SGJ19_12670 [Planctomycetia bacterium]|nr:hypothetical protein [Planctomycetia bacterium]